MVFCCGAVLEDDKSLKINWGAADTVMCTGTLHIESLVDQCLENSRPAMG
ncbi:MAG: hypothetical protein JXK95_12540 [Bacteroidales bacterium]|nr:hypothetical protein [Bacteroidales bacterium]